MPARPKLPVLIILHQETSTPGRIGLRLKERGYCLDIRRPAMGDPLPATLAGHAGAVMFGGPMSANDEHDYIRRELEWLAVPLGEQAPFFGVCLGAQLLAKHLGASVGHHREGNVEVGYYPLHATEAGRALMTPWPDLVYQWHREGFDLPRDATLLAEGDTFPNQAYRFGNAFGIQFHVELTLAMVHRWTTKGHERLALPGAQPRHHHFEQRAVHDHKTQAWLNGFLDHWLSLGEARQGEPAPVRAAS